MTRLNTLSARVASLPNRLPTAQPGSWRAGKTSSTARGYGYDWQRLRSRHLADNPYCVMCLAELGMTGLTLAAVVLACAEEGKALPIGNVVDHIVKHEGRDALRMDPGNLQTLCKPHHDGEKQRQERREAV